MSADPKTPLDEAREALAAFDRANAVPPCRLCGKPLTLQECDSFSQTWACEGGDWRNGRWSAFDDSPGRTLADEHYSRSQFMQSPNGMSNHLRAALVEVDRLTAENTRLREALANLRDAAQPAYAAGRVDALAFVAAGNVLAEVTRGQ